MELCCTGGPEVERKLLHYFSGNSMTLFPLKFPVAGSVQRLEEFYA